MVRADHALSISKTTNHAIDLEGGIKLVSHLTNVPANTYAIRISDITRISILVRANCSAELFHISVKTTGEQGIYFFGTSSKKASGSISDFEVSGTTGDAVYLKYAMWFWEMARSAKRSLRTLTAL